MPNQVYFPDDPMSSDSSGIGIQWTPSTGRLYINGWYDTFVGIEGTRLSLCEFFRRLGITEKDCRKAFKEANDVQG